MRVLFILKQRTDYGNYSYSGGFSSGLLNSAQFAADMLAANGYDTKVVEVVDNNDIDREVAAFAPDTVIIEALWVVPSKFPVLTRLHPHVQWIVRVHSEAAFLSQERIAIDWITQYVQLRHVHVALNSKEGFNEIATVLAARSLDESRLLDLPTFYPAPHKVRTRKFKGKVIDIACMGAIRPLKNNLMQALAALSFVRENDLDLRFHINSTRIESGGNPVFDNLVALFVGTPYTLVLHDWMKHDEFLAFMSTVDMSMQVSFSETFSIIAADSVSVATPIVGSEAIPWLTSTSQADLITVSSIVETMEDVLNNSHNTKANLRNLQRAAKDAEAAWLEVI